MKLDQRYARLRKCFEQIEKARTLRQGRKKRHYHPPYSDFALDHSAKLRWPADEGLASLRRVDDPATRFGCAEISGSKIRFPDVCLQRHRCPRGPPATGGRRGRVQSKALRSAAETARPWP